MGKVAEKRKPPPRRPRTRQSEKSLFAEVTMGDNGRLVIPAEVRAALGLREGDKFVLRLTPVGIVLKTQRMALRTLQELAKRYVPQGRSLADELIAERRLEAERE
jgi:AbrB family looped-hinge helix DNA binding protein